MWLKQLKIALVEKNITRLSELMNELPELTSKEDLDAAICLLDEATSLVSSFQNQTQEAMIQMQKNIKFLKVTEEKKTSSLDIKL